MQEYTFDDFLDSSFQQILLALGARDKDFLARSIAVLRAKYFSTSVNRAIWHVLEEYYREFHDLPAQHTLTIATAKQAEDKPTADAYAEAVKALYNMNDDDLDRPYIENEVIQFCQRAEAASVVGQAYSNLKLFDIDDITQRFKAITNMPSIYANLGLDMHNDWEYALAEDVRERFPTGWAGLDLAMRGGAREGELVSIMAPLKRGKSFILTNIGAALNAMGYTIAHYTLEMYEPDVLRRYLACFSGKPVNELEKYLNDIRDVLDELKVYTSGSIIVKEFPGHAVTWDTIEGHLTMVEAERKTKVIPIVDYADLVLPPRQGREFWQELGDGYVAARGMGRRHGVPVYTASQTNAGGFKAAKLHEGHQSGGTQKGFVADYMFAVNQSDEDYAVNRFQLESFLSRHDRKFQASFWLADYPCCRMKEISEPEYKALMPEHIEHEEDEDKVGKFKKQKGKTMKVGDLG